MENTTTSVSGREDVSDVIDTFTIDVTDLHAAGPAAEDEPHGRGDASLFDSINDAMLVLSMDTVIERVNPAAVALTGFSGADLVGQSVDVLARSRRTLGRVLQKILARDDLRGRLETYCARKDGTFFPISVSVSKIWDSAARDHKIVCIAQDISKRKRLEAEARVISKIIHGATTTTSLDEFLKLVHRWIKTILYADNCFVALFDSETELLTMQFFVDKYDQMPPPLKVGRGLTAYVFRSGKPMLLRSADVDDLVAKGEVEAVGTDSSIWMGIPLRTPEGVIGVLVVQDYDNSDTYAWQDVELLTSVADQIAVAIERKRSEDALRKSQERFDLMARATSDAIWDWNLETSELWWNMGFQELFGYRGDEIGTDVGSWADRVHPDDADRVIHDIHLHIESGNHKWSDEYRFRRSDGSYAHVIDRGYVVHDNGKPMRMIGSMMDVTDRKSLEDQLTHQALHDPLTNIANRVLFRDRVEHALAKQTRDRTSLAVLFLDLDNFKAINDSLGHAAGDKLLVAVAKRLQDCLRNTDTAARLSGDEFAVLVEYVQSSEEAEMIGERIRTVFSEPFTIDGKDIHVGTSIGIASSSHGTVTTEELLRNADLAMYLAKNEGKNRYIVFEPKMHEALVERIELEADLRRAIDTKEFILNYQPIIDLQSGSMLGMEALVRWRHPRRGMLAPDKFIPLAEETSLIVPLGEWILLEACTQTQIWRAKHPDQLGVSVTVNISIRQFQQPELVQMVSSALEKSGLPPGCLILEITESFMIQDTEITIAKLHELKALGIRLAIDDFGTGYSSLSYLQRFPIDILKIDRSFVEKISQGKEGRAVARAIIMMGDSLSLKTIAEGIEHPEQIEALQTLGCEAGQGYHFAHPLSKEAMEEFLLNKFPVAPGASA